MAEEAVQEVQEAPEWVSGIEDENVRTFASGFQSQDEVLKAIGYEPPAVEEKDWREQITDEDAKKFAETSSDLNHFVKRALDLRAKASQPRVPGKDASEDEVASYRKAIGIPDAPEKYEFPEVPKEQMTDQVKASQESWGKRFHELNIPGETAKTLMKFVSEDVAATEQAMAEADKRFAKQQEDALKSEWGGEFDQNKDIANKALGELANRAGVKLDDLTQIEMKDGRFLLDRAEFVRMFAALGREMGEGTLGPTITDAEAESVESEVRQLREQIQDAQQKGDNKLAHKLYQKELKLLSRLGDQPIVGAQGRAA